MDTDTKIIQQEKHLKQKHINDEQVGNKHVCNKPLKMDKGSP